jgi:hypothetical protein
VASDTANLFLKHLVIKSSFEFSLSSWFDAVSAVFDQERGEIEEVNSQLLKPPGKKPVLAIRNTKIKAAR